MENVTEPVVPKKPHTSASQINTFTNCGEQYRRRYLEKEIIPPGVAAVRGSSVHKGAEHNFVQKIKTFKDLPKAEIVDRAVAEFEARVKADGVFMSDEEEAKGRAVVIGAEKDRTVRLTGVFASDVAPVYQPEAVELKQTIVLPKAPRDILGILDFVGTKVAEPTQKGIVDFKSVAKSKGQKTWDADPALSIYDLTFRAKEGRAPDFIAVEELVDTKVPKRVSITTSRSRRDFEALVARVNTVVSAVDAGVFVPANVGWWGCSPKWCGYWKTCAYVNAERKAAADSDDAG